MLLPLPMMQYIGEEGLYALKAWEMHVRHDWWHPSILGNVWPHPPFFHWPVILLSNLIGWEHVDIAQRLVSVAASWFSALVVGLMARHLYPGRRCVGWLTALLYLSMGEVFFWYGWLGYADALFAMFILTGFAALWLAIEREHAGWLLLSLLAIVLAYITKNFTAYVLYGLAGIVMLFRLRQWHLLKRLDFLLMGVAALAVIWLYQVVIIHSDSNATVTWHDILRNFTGYTVWAYLRHWLGYPWIFLFRTLPVGILLFWMWFRKRHAFTLQEPLGTLLWVVAVWFLPFWIPAGGSPRYLVPLYGPVALLFTGWLLQLSGQQQRMAVRAIIVVLILKVPYSLVALPWLKDWRPNHSQKAVAQDVLRHADGKPIYTRDDIASGLGVAAYIDVRLPPDRFVRWYRGKMHGVFIMAEQPTPGLGKLVKRYTIRGRHLYLYWRS